MKSTQLRLDRAIRELAKHAKISALAQKIPALALFCACACLCASAAIFLLVLALGDGSESSAPLTIAEAAQTAFATSTPVAVLLCANRHGSLVLKEQLKLAVDAYNTLSLQGQTGEKVTTETKTLRASRLVVHTECAKAQWDAIGKLLFEDLFAPASERDAFRPRYALLVTDHDQYPLSVRSPRTLIQHALADILVHGQPDMLGAAATVEDPSVVLPGAFPFKWAEVTPETVARSDDTEWWDTGRPYHINKTRGAAGAHVNGPAVAAAARPLQQQQLPLRKNNAAAAAAAGAAAVDPTLLRPCFMFPRKEWTMRILPSSTGLNCDAVGSSFLLNVDVIKNMAGTASLRRKVWPPTSASSLDAGLVDFFITLKRARWRGLITRKEEEDGEEDEDEGDEDKDAGGEDDGGAGAGGDDTDLHRTGIAAATVPWFSVSAASSENRGRAFDGTRPCILDGIGVEWFPSSVMHRHTATLPLTAAVAAATATATSETVQGAALLDGTRPLRATAQRVPSTRRQRAMIAALSRRHDLRELEAPDGSVMHLGCAADQGRCPMHFVERGFSMPPCCRAKLRKLLLYMSHALTERGVVHWIDFGTLIGAVRTTVAGRAVAGGKLLSHDYDADIVVDARQWGVVRAMQAHVAAADGHVLFEEQEGFIRFFFSAHNGVYVDLYAAQPAQPGEVPALQAVRDEMARDAEKDAAATAGLVGVLRPPPPRQMWYLTAGKQDWFDASYVFPMGTCVMEGETLPCPTRPREFLEKWRANLYGGKKVWGKVSRKLYKGPEAQLRGGPRPADFMEGKTRDTFERWMEGFRLGA